MEKAVKEPAQRLTSSVTEPRIPWGGLLPTQDGATKTEVLGDLPLHSGPVLVDDSLYHVAEQALVVAKEAVGCRRARSRGSLMSAIRVEVKLVDVWPVAIA